MSLPALDIPSLLHRHGLRPEKSLGQNFLIDESALQNVVEIAHISPQDIVLEIGAGLGSLTRYLAVAAHSVVAVELDEKLLPLLHHVLTPYPNINIVHGDILRLHPTHLVAEPGYLVVANIPYYITSALIRHLLESPSKPSRLVLTVQKEVAQRICAAPGDLSLLALSVQVYGQPTIAAHIPAAAFYPPPKVDSSVLCVDIYPVPRIPSHLLESFFRLTKAGFSQKRKTLRNALAGGLGWTTAKTGDLLNITGIDPFRRAESLSLDEWHALTLAFSPH